MKKQKRSHIETMLMVLLGHLSRNGIATEEDKEAMVRTIYLVHKYLPIHRSEEEP